MQRFLWVFDADGIFVLPLLSAGLFALGGSGVLSIRRFAFPALVSLSAFSEGLSLRISCLSGLLLFVATILPWGDSLKNLFKGLYFEVLLFIGALYGLALSPLALAHKHWFLIWFCPVFMAFLVPSLFFCSQKFNFPKHKFVEILIGGFLGYFTLGMIK
jgi:hypothetical protein